MMFTEPHLDYKTLIDLYERTRKGDQAAHTALEEWFDARCETMRRGKEARQEVSTLAYLVAEKEATKRLAPGRRYDDLPNDPASVASRHWMRFQPFCEDVEAGKAKTVDEFVHWINRLVKHVLDDLAEEKSDDVSLAESGVDVPDPDDPDGKGDVSPEDHAEWLERKRAILRRIFQVLEPKLFIVLILREYCHFEWKLMAEILGTTEYFIKLDYKEAMKQIGQQVP